MLRPLLGRHGLDRRHAFVTNSLAAPLPSRGRATGLPQRPALPAAVHELTGSTGCRKLGRACHETERSGAVIGCPRMDLPARRPTEGRGAPVALSYDVASALPRGRVSQRGDE